MDIENEDHIRYLAGVHVTMTALELVIDEYGLSKVLDMLTDVCYGKANYIREYNSQDADAKGWDDIAGEFSKLSNRVSQTGE
jgi:hypothetical protein